MLDGTHYFECSCGSAEHTIRFVLDKSNSANESDEWPMIYCDFYLDYYIPWYKRIWVAIKYILKCPATQSHFDTWIMRDEDAERLKEMCEEFLDAR